MHPPFAASARRRLRAWSRRWERRARRPCAENGASIVKTYYTEDFDKITETCPVPVVIAGGPLGHKCLAHVACPLGRRSRKVEAAQLAGRERGGRRAAAVAGTGT